MKYKLIILRTILSLLIIFIAWLGYSLIIFDGFFPPAYVIGINNPYKYYQKNIGDLLVKHGQEYELNVKTDGWKKYSDINHEFEFKYPEKLIVKNIIQDEQHYQINFIDNDSSNECEITIEFKGRGIGREWLPRMRRNKELNIGNREQLWYLRTLDNSVFSIESTRFLNNDRDEIKFTGITFIKMNSNKFLRINDYGNTCSEDIIKGIFATLKF